MAPDRESDSGTGTPPAFEEREGEVDSLFTEAMRAHEDAETIMNKPKVVTGEPVQLSYCRTI